MPTAPTSATELLDLLQRSGVACPEKLAGVSDLTLPPDPQKAAALLVSQGVVTRFQAQQLLAGRHKGFRVGPYVILDLLGRGGMGAVYLGEHRELHRKVAIKVLVPGRDDDQKLAVERFQREARAAAALDHPNIVRIFDVSRFGETPYLVMEYIEGETLQQVLDRDGAMPFPAATEYVAQAAAGLQHAHEKGFVHRDIKPANLIRDTSGTVKILDMGLARSDNTKDKLTEQLDQGAVVGTADFIAPEQGLNQAVDIRADIYSLGATFFALLVGKPPFDGNTTQKLLQHQLKNPPSVSTIDATLPTGLSGVVAKMLAKKPADRYRTPAEVIAALAPWLGSSARILAGLSRTNLAQGANLQATLSEIARGSSRRLGVTDSGEVNPSQAAQETGSVAGAATTREPSRTKEPAARPGRKKVVLYAGVGAAVLAAGVLAGWLTFGRGKKQPDPVPVENAPRPEPEPKKIDGPKPNPNPTPNSNPSPVVPKKDPTPAAETVVFRSDFAGLKPFVVRSGLSVDPNDANKKTYRFVSRSGSGDLPPGWSARSWNKDTEMECFAEEGANPSLGIRAAGGPGSAMLFMPKFECPSGVCRLRVEYSAGVRDGRFSIRFKASDSRPAWDVAKPPATGPAWRTEEVEADLKGAAGGFFEFHNSDDRPDVAVRLRSVTVTALGGTVRKEQSLFSLDAADLPAFKNTKQGRARTAGDDDPKIKGVYFGGWKPDTVSEWECGPVAGAKAVALTNLNEVVSAQIGLELESAGGIGLRLEPGARVRLRVVYRTTGKGRGSAYFQTPSDHKVPDRAALPNSNDDWATVELVTVRGDRPLRCLIDTTEPGAGNTLFVRSVTVSELGKGTPIAVNPPTNPSPPAADPNDPARWAEGATVFALDVARIPAFRVQKEKGARLGGDAEQLPPGVGCQCWKDGGVGDFRCERIDDVPVLSVTNLNDQKSGQFFFGLEGGMKIPLQPGKAYRVKVGYMTRNEAAGTTTVQVVPGYKGIASARLSNTGGKWATAAASFVRPPAEDRVEVRTVVENATVGEGNALCVRSLEVVELLPPGKK